MNQEEVRYFEVYKTEFDKNAGVNPIQKVAVMVNQNQRKKQDYRMNESSLKNFGYKAIIHEMRKGKIAIDFISHYTIEKFSKPIPIEEVDYLLADVVNNLK